MKKHFIMAIAAILCVSIHASGQVKTKFTEKVEKKGDELVIPYEKYQLANGLTVLIHEDHSDPVVHVDVTYHVGSAREVPGRSGFAHFFEHMMFQGSDNVADEEHFKIVSESGGTLNGTTNSDRTNYFETMPSNQMETALWLEADRMGFFLDAVTQQKFEIQRATVKNERGQNYDNRPYGLVREKVAQAMYPYGHAYSWPVIGYLEDLNHATVEDLKKFFLRWYGPNNATLTVAGDVNTAEVLAKAEKYFGPIPMGPHVLTAKAKKVTLDADRYISYEDNIRFPLIQLAFPTVPNFHPDEAPLDVLSDILGGGKNSLFYQKFVKSQIAINANVSHPCAELGGQFELTVLPFPGKSLADVEKMIRETIEEFEKRGVNDEDLNSYKARHESGEVNSLASVSGKASKLASYQTYMSNPNYISKDLERYNKVTKEDVMKVFNLYVKGKNAVVLSVYPKGKPELKVKEDTFVPKFFDLNQKPDDTEYKNLTYNKAKDNFDRKKRPAAGATPVVKVPELWKDNFPNGMSVMGAETREIPSVTLRLSFPAGHRVEEADKSGLAQLTASLIDESTAKRTSEEIERQLELLGSSVRLSAGKEDIVFSISSLTKNLVPTLKIAEEVLFSPLFSQEDFDRVKKQQLEQIANQVTQATVIADNVFGKILYGDGNIMGIPVIGTTETVSRITLEDVKNYYNKFINPKGSKLVIVGDISKKEILPALEFLKSWKEKPYVKQTDKPAPAIEKTKIYLVDKDKAPQSEIRIGYIALPYDATGEYYTANVMNFILGGAFNSRINLNLREDKGYTYGARSHFEGSQFAGPFKAGAGVRADATDSSLVEFMKEIKTYVEGGITPDELAFTKNSLGQGDALKYETPAQKAGFLQRILDYSLSRDYILDQNKILQKMTKEQVDKAAKKLLPYDKMVIVVVGDKKLIHDGLSKLGYEIVEVKP